MAKKQVAAKPESNRSQIDARLAAHNFGEAWKLARQGFNLGNAEEATENARLVIRKACEHFADANNPSEFTRYYEYAVNLPKVTDDSWTKVMGLLQARAGYYSRAHALLSPLNDPIVLAKAREYVADRTIVAKLPGLLPEEYRATYDSVIAAFAAFHAADDATARERLNAVGLQSPYLEWKILLRGLIALAGGDDARAVENFARTDGERLPGRIATVLRAGIDPEFRKKLPGDAATDASRRYRLLVPGGLHSHFELIQENLGRGKSMGPAFSAVEAAMPFIKAQKPELVDRLANCFYHAMRHQGQPEDMRRYRKTFGRPKGDPYFEKLQGMVFKQVGDLNLSISHWTKFAEWLEGNPEGWPEEIARRALAKVRYRLGCLILDMSDSDEDDDDDDDYDQGGFFGFLPKPKPKPKPKKGASDSDPKIHLARAFELAPDWVEPAEALFELYSDSQDFAKAKAVAKVHLEHNPHSLGMLSMLALLHARTGDPEESLAIRKKAVAANPLDQTARNTLRRAAVGYARALAVQKKFDEAEQVLHEEADVSEGTAGLNELALRASIARKTGRLADAEKFEAATEAIPHGMLAALYLKHIHAIILKDKPAEKKAVAAAFTEALKKPLPPEVWELLVFAMRVIEAEGLKFTGEVALRKKIFTAIGGSAQPNCEAASEKFAQTLADLEEWAILQKLAVGLAKRYPRNPLFLLLDVEAAMNQPTVTAAKSTLQRKLNKAEDLIRFTPESRFKDLLPRIKKIQTELNPIGSFFESFFFPR